MIGDEASGLDYWTQWQVFACALIVAAPTATAGIVLSKSIDKQLRRSDLWIPCWRRLHPICLLVYRAFVVVFASYLLFEMVVRDGVIAFHYYTQWTLALVLVYFVIGTVISAHGCWNNLKQSGIENDTEKGLLERENVNLSNKVRLLDYKLKEFDEGEAGFWGYAMQIIYQTSAAAAIFTDIVFWVLLAPGRISQDFSIDPLMTCVHSLNLVFLLLDAVLNSLPFPAFRMAYFIFWSGVYVTFTWVVHACGFSKWPYPFFDLSTRWAPGWYMGMALIHFPCYFSYWIIIRAKILFFPKWFPQTYIRS